MASRKRTTATAKRLRLPQNLPKWLPAALGGVVVLSLWQLRRSNMARMAAVALSPQPVAAPNPAAPQIDPRVKALSDEVYAIRNDYYKNGAFGRNTGRPLTDVEYTALIQRFDSLARQLTALKVGKPSTDRSIDAIDDALREIAAGSNDSGGSVRDGVISYKTGDILHQFVFNRDRTISRASWYRPVTLDFVRKLIADNEGMRRQNKDDLEALRLVADYIQRGSPAPAPTKPPCSPEIQMEIDRIPDLFSGVKAQIAQQLRDKAGCV